MKISEDDFNEALRRFTTLSNDMTRRSILRAAVEAIPEPASHADALPVPGAAVRALVERYKGDHSRETLFRVADELEAALAADGLASQELPTREELAPAIRQAYFGRDCKLWGEAGEEYFRIADYVLGLLARPSTDEAECTEGLASRIGARADELHKAMPFGTYAECLAKAINEHIAARPETVVIDEALAERVFDAYYRAPNVSGRTAMLVALRSVFDDRASVAVPKGEPLPHAGPFTPEREAELRKKPAHYCVHEVFPVLDQARARAARVEDELRRIEHAWCIEGDYCPDHISDNRHPIERRLAGMQAMHLRDVEKLRATIHQIADCLGLVERADGTDGYRQPRDEWIVSAVRSARDKAEQQRQQLVRVADVLGLECDPSEVDVAAIDAVGKLRAEAAMHHSSWTTAVNTLYEVNVALGKQTPGKTDNPVQLATQVYADLKTARAKLALLEAGPDDYTPEQALKLADCQARLKGTLALADERSADKARVEHELMAVRADQAATRKLVDNLDAELEKTRAELEAQLAHQRELGAVWDRDYNALRDRHAALLATARRWRIEAPHADSIWYAEQVERALLKPAPAEAEPVAAEAEARRASMDEWVRRKVLYGHDAPPARAEAEPIDQDRNKGRACICGADLSEPGSRHQHRCRYTQDQPPESAMADQAHQPLALPQRVQRLENVIGTFLSDWARGSFNKERAAEVLAAFEAREGAK